MSQDICASGYTEHAYCPGTGAFSALHAKTWCADGEVYFGGSFNFSRNAAVNNEEHLIAIRDPGAVRVHEGWFHPGSVG